MKKLFLKVLFVFSVLLSLTAFISSTSLAQTSNSGAIWTTNLTSGVSPQNNGVYTLNLSHIACVGTSVEVHFVLLGTVDGDTISNLTYNYGTISPGKISGNVVHFTDYLGSGYIDVTSATVTVNGQTVTLHNPSAYSGNYNCTPATATPITPTSTSVTPTATSTSTPTDTPTNTPTDTPTNTPTDTPTNTPTDTPTNTPTNTPTSTATPTLVIETPDQQPTVPIINTPTNTATSTAVIPTNTPTNTATSTAVIPTATTVVETPVQQPTVPSAATLIPTSASTPVTVVTKTTGPTPVPQKAPATGGPSNPALLQGVAFVFALISIVTFVILRKEVD